MQTLLSYRDKDVSETTHAYIYSHFLPGNINKNEALDIWKLNFMLVNLKFYIFMKISGMTHFLQPNF